MFKLIRLETSPEEALSERHQWAVKFVAKNSEDDSPARIFVMQVSPDAGVFSDTFSCVANAIQMSDLPEDEPADGSPFYRVASVKVLCRSAEAAEEFVEKAKAAVQDLADNLYAADTLSVVEVTGIGPAALPPPSLLPTIVLLSPANGALAVPVATSAVVTFHEDVLEGSGDIVLKNLTDETEEAIAIGDALVDVDGPEVTVDLSGLLEAGKNYAIRIEAGALVDGGGGEFAGVDDDDTWNFFT